MKYFVKTAALLLSLITSTSCNTLLGPPGSESESSFPSPADSFPYDKYVEGKPPVNLRVQGGFYIWKTGNVWSVRVAKKIERSLLIPPAWPVLNGSIEIERGLAVDLRKQNLSRFNTVEQKRMNDISFRFELKDDIGNGIEGFDFTVRPAGSEYCIIIDVTVDSIPHPELVYLGSFMHNPDTLPLKICMHSFH